ncbi:hypothetical protein AWC23_06415 [Mycobacterium saskatchewanense]|uniref:ATP-dependent acyl-CoA ligase n=1 Tax=Mycobacterium saskatchewanense TaxID=220927 RepID=A0AAJ3NTH2_9MYCO|nr:hypothetical protein AWC23_06415 [Mycobacterium saskatchewanense]
MTIWFGAALIGVVIVPINTAHLGDGLVYQLRDSEPSLMVVDDELVSRIEAISAEVAIDNIFVNGAMPTTTLALQPIARLLHGADAPLPEMVVQREDPATIMYTSGTTGPPKGCVLPHGQYVAAAFLHASNCGYDERTVIYSCLPLFHINAQNYTIMSAVAAGAAVVMDRRFSASRFWVRLSETGTTAFNFIGSMALSLWNQPRTPAEREHRAQVAFGVPVPSDIWTQWEERFGCRVVYAYGMTENALAAMITYDEVPVPVELHGSAGRPSATTQVSILDDRGKLLPPKSVGHIVTRPKIAWTMMTEYWRNPEATAAAFKGCWFHTGDLGYLDDNGYLFYVDRKKDALRRKGEMISSWEIESVVAKFPSVAECAVVAVPSALGEDEILVVVVPQPGARVEPVALIEFCGERMPNFQIPRYVRVLDAMPRTQTQRIEKYRLRRDGVTADTWDALAHH